MRWLKSISFGAICALATTIILAMVAILIGDVVWYGRERLTFEFITARPRMGITEGGVFPAIVGTVFLVVLMTIAVVPLGVATAVYLNEYARRDSKLVLAVRLAIQNLAGVPAIVFGLFGCGFFILFIGRGIDVAGFGGRLVFGQPCILWASLTMALLTLPTVVVATEEALRAVPQVYREAACALGATRWQVVSRIVLPQSVGGILTGAILAVSRGTGEVAPIMFTGVAYLLPYLPDKLTSQFMHLGYHIYVLATQSPNVEATRPLLYSSVLLLLILTFALNLTGILIRSRIRRRLRTG